MKCGTGRTCPSITLIAVLLLFSGFWSSYVMAVTKVEVANALEEGDVLVTKIKKVKDAVTDDLKELTSRLKDTQKQRKTDEPGAPLPEAKTMEQFRERYVWLQDLTKQVEQRVEAAKGAHNTAMAQVLLRDAIIKAEQGKALASSIQQASQTLNKYYADRMPSAPPQGRRIELPTGDVLKQLMEVERRSHEAERATDSEAIKGGGVRSFEPSTPRPGGILFSKEMASQLAMHLRIRGVAYDRRQATLTVVGEERTQALDVDFLVTMLRAVFDPHYQYASPYFSLDPVDEESHGSAQGRYYDVMYDEADQHLAKAPFFLKGYPCPGGEVNGFVPWEFFETVADAWGFVRRWCPLSDTSANSLRRGDLYRRLKAAGITRFKAWDGEIYILVGSLSDLDSGFYDELVSKHSVLSSKLVFGPTWLKETRVGEILFIADAAIKEIEGPLSFYDHQPSRVMSVPRHIPVKVFHESGDPEGYLGRFWFYPAGKTGEDNEYLDLSQIRPRLGYVRGHAGRNMDMPDLPLEKSSQQAVQDVNDRFEEYARALDEWDKLADIFRAYVLAVWLKEKAPDLAQRLLAALPDPRKPRGPLPEVYWKPVAVFLGDGGISRRNDGGYRWRYTSGTDVGGISFSRDKIVRVPLSEDALQLKTRLAELPPNASTGTIGGLKAIRFLLPIPPVAPQPKPAAPVPRKTVEKTPEVTLLSKWDLRHQEETVVAQYRAVRAQVLPKEGGLPRWVVRNIPPGAFGLLYVVSAGIVWMLQRSRLIP